jgi:hypothetical protein
MEVNRTLELGPIDEIKIISNIRVIHRHDLNPVYSKENLQVQFTLSGDLRGSITSYLCIDNCELSSSEKNYIYPMFVESMNILLGRQISLDHQLGQFNIRISPPKLNMISQEINTDYKSSMQKYELDLDGRSFIILNQYCLEGMN